jgi:P27 family predicted phage terminase small subunit
VGRRGPAREPDAAKLRRGETRPSRLNGLEPLPRSGRMPTMPPGMTTDAQAAWRHVIREMRDAGVITGADAHLLRLYCEAYARYLEAARLYASASPLIADRGHLAKNPLHQVVRDHADQVRMLARELGLSPVARAGLRIVPGADVPDIEAEIGPPPRLRVLATDA